VKVIYGDVYHCPEATSLTSTRKQKEVFEAALAAGLVAPADVVAPRPIEREALLLAHGERYVDAVLAGEPRALAQSQGFRWSEAFRDLVLHTAGGQVAGCELALRDGIAAHLASGAHHARRDHGGGFCTFNFLVVAPRLLMGRGTIARAMVVDLDTHQGDGTWSLVRDDPRFCCFDISGVPFGVPEHDGPDGLYRVVEDAREYFAVLARLPARIADFRPDIVLYQAGMDGFEDDPMGAVPGLDEARLRERDRLVFEACRDASVPCVWNLAGGYIHGVTYALHVDTLREALAVHGRRTG